MRTSPRRFVVLALAAAWLLPAVAARAAEPLTGAADGCVGFDGQGQPCTTSADCATYTVATACIKPTSGAPTCQVPCEQGAPPSVGADPQLCALGETCTDGYDAGNQHRFYCRKTRFRVDLNLLDQCISMFLEGQQPTLGGTGQDCSMQANLTRLLDQNGDFVFDVFDLDLCILAFLEQPGCRSDGSDSWIPEQPDDDLVCCADDATCGAGLYCDAERHVCQRECGMIVSRELGVDALERPCTGRLKACDEARGRCLPIDLTDLTCDTDDDCPSGAYCFLGQCEEQCYRATDCPEGDWYCDLTNRCRAVPPPVGEIGFSFDPHDYAVRFARDGLQLDAVKTSDQSELLILDLLTRRQVLGNPAVGFGYRLQVSYGLKQDQKCLKPFVDCSDPKSLKGESQAECQARQDDCYIDDTEEWIRLVTPFGKVTAAAHAAIGVELEPSVAEHLSAGVYPATLRVVFDNGDSDSLPITFTRKSPSGEYTGRLTVYLDGPANSLTGSRPLTLGMRVKVEDTPTTWHELLVANHLQAGGEALIDLTSGVLVHALMHGNSSLAFTASGVTTSAANEVPFVGLYSPEQGRLRLIGVIDVAADFCLGEDGACDDSDALQVKARNPFGRDIRRQIELIGPYDATQGLFHGLYRERISGLAADYDVTLEGGFMLSQGTVDESEPEGFAFAGVTGTVAFPSNDDVLAEVDDAIEAYCTSALGEAYASRSFGSATAFDQYLQQANRTGEADDGTAGRIFPDLVEFDQAIQEALTALGSGAAAQQDYLNIYDFLLPRLAPCSADAASPPPACIDEDAARCGLALYQKALLSGWVGGWTTLNATAGTQNELVCPESLTLEGCPDRAADAPALFTLQDHNRFWWDLGQIQKFDADSGLSNAFLVLYRNAANTFLQQSALSYKAEQLVHAVARYDDLIGLFAGNVAAKVLFQWPARAFKEMGYDWLGIMQEIAGSRMDALSGLIDLRRRVFLGTEGHDFVFAHHLMQHEYLLQVYLMALQQHWQQEQFGYLGAAATALDKGQAILNQLAAGRNVLGLVPSRVYFENSSLDTSNWRAFLAQLVGDDGKGGMMAEAREQVSKGAAELKGSLSDLDSLQEKLFEAKLEYKASVNEICGRRVTKNADGTLVMSAEDLAAGPLEGASADGTLPYCDHLMALVGLENDGSDPVLTTLRACLLNPDGATEGCPSSLPYACGDTRSSLDQNNDCESVVKVFDYFASGGTDDDLSNTAINEAMAEYYRYVEEAVYGTPCVVPQVYDWMAIRERDASGNDALRYCVGGKMGELIRQKSTLDLNRRVTVKKVSETLIKIHTKISYFAAKHGIEGAKAAAEQAAEIAGNAIDLFKDINEQVKVLTGKTANAPDCTFIVGMAVGTDCLGHGIATVTQMVVEGMSDVVSNALAVTKFILDTAKGLVVAALEFSATYMEDDMEIRELVQEATEQIDELEASNHELMNLAAQIDDLRFEAQRAADIYSSKARFVAEHLVNRETGNVLLGNQLVRQADQSFRDLVLFAYKMTMAFIHEYNLTTGDATALVNKAQAVVTLDDVQSLADDLSDRERDYCGLEALDCDSANNVEVLRYSLRAHLFPQLHDVVDPQTNKVVTAGEQFHNLITQPPYLTRRVRANEPTDQIELSFSIPVTLLENTASGAPQWLIDPLSCNHLLDPRAPESPDYLKNGTVAVNVVGKNLGDDTGERRVRYQLVRGATDFLRGCHPESVIEEVGTLPVLEYPIRKHIIGYAPQSTQSSLGEPVSFVTVSAPFTACLNQSGAGNDMVSAPCWRYFARDRSLASTDWKLVLPVMIGDGGTDNTWLLGTGLPDDQRPIVDDIVIYFRYRSRPIQEE